MAGWLPLLVPGPLYGTNDFSDSWTASHASLNVGGVAAPIGTGNGSLLTEDSAGSVQHLISKQTSVSLVQTQLYTVTAYAKQTSGTRNLRLIVLDPTQTSFVSVDYDLASATVSSFDADLNYGFSGASASLVNGWCKMSFLMEDDGVSPTNLMFKVMLLSGASDTYSGDGSSTVGLWGLEIR